MKCVRGCPARTQRRFDKWLRRGEVILNHAPPHVPEQAKADMSHLLNTARLAMNREQRHEALDAVSRAFVLLVTTWRDPHPGGGYL